MQFSVINLAMFFSAGLVMAAPAPRPGPAGPPPPPPGKSVAAVSQSCSASQSSISCCNQAGGPGPAEHGPPGPAEVAYNSQIFNLQCSQIIAEEAEAKNPVLNICSTTVACCIGTGCVAIAE